MVPQMFLDNVKKTKIKSIARTIQIVKLENEQNKIAGIEYIHIISSTYYKLAY